MVRHTDGLTGETESGNTMCMQSAVVTVHYSYPARVSMQMDETHKNNQDMK